MTMLTFCHTDSIPNKPSLAYWIPRVFEGLGHDYANMSTWLDQNLVPERAAEFRQTNGMCTSANDFYGNKTMSDYFKNGYASWHDAVPASVLTSGGVMGLRGTPKAPWYLYEVSDDEVSPIQSTRDLYDKYCAQGASIYVRGHDSDCA